MQYSQIFEPISPSDTLQELLDKSVRVVPTARQLAWQKMELTAFIHFSVNTFTDREWGAGNETVSLFNPQHLNADQWVGTLSECGFKGVIMTCKHHDGFCLWPSAYTEFSVKNAPWKDGKGDAVKEVSDACRRAGIKFGIYLSPWDIHEKTYGVDCAAYNRFFKNQLRELLTNYGEIYEVWFDGACGEGPDGKKQEYDWAGYYALIRELQKDAVISIAGPDVRWVGNEAGRGREFEWSVVPHGERLVDQDSGMAFLQSETAICDAEIGSAEQLLKAKENFRYMFWYPAQVDTSIRPGWFYHPWEDGKVKSLGELIRIYESSVGSNAQLLLNVPPAPTGSFAECDVARLKEFADYLTQAYKDNLAVTSPENMQGCLAEIPLRTQETINQIVLQEDIVQGQRVGKFRVEARVAGEWRTVGRGGTIGYKKILRLQTVQTDRIRVIAEEYRADPRYAFIGVYHVPVLCPEPRIIRDKQGIIRVEAENAVEITYSVNGQPYQPYNGPFAFPDAGTIQAQATFGGDRFWSSNQAQAQAEFGVSRRSWTVISCDGVPEQRYSVEDLVDDEKAFVVFETGAPLEVIFDMHEICQVNGFLYAPIDDLYEHGTNMEYYTLSVGETLEQLTCVASGRLQNLQNNPVPQRIPLTQPVQGRYLKLTASRGLSVQRIGIGKLTTY